MRILRTLITVAAAIPFLACSSSRIQIDYDHQADFSNYSTFSWYLEEKDGGPTEGPSQIVSGRIRRAIAEVGAVMIVGKMQDDATVKQCKVMVELARMLAEKDADLKAAYQF